QMSKGVIDSSEVLFDYCFAALPIGIADRVFDCLDCFFTREDTANGEETSLHDGVDATGHAGFPRDLVSIDDIELQPLFDDVLLNRFWQMVPNFRWCERSIEQECSARLCRYQYVHAFEELELMAGHKARLTDEV